MNIDKLEITLVDAHEGYEVIVAVFADGSIHVRPPEGIASDFALTADNIDLIQEVSLLAAVFGADDDESGELPGGLGDTNQTNGPVNLMDI